MGEHTIPALTRGLGVLKLVSAQDAALSYYEIGRQTRIPQSSLTRLLNSLVTDGYLRRENGKYKPGDELLALSRAFPSRARLLAMSGAALAELSKKTHNTAILIYWNGSTFQCIDKVMHPHSTAMQEVGVITTDFSASPWGYLFYNTLDAEKKATAQRLVTKGRAFENLLKFYLEQYEKGGFIYDDCLDYRYIRRLAALVYEHDKVCGAVVLGGNTLTMPDENINTLARAVCQTAKYLSVD